MSTSKFSSDHETFVQIFQLSCSLENKIYMRVCRKNIRVQCGIIFYHVLFTCAKYFAFCRSRIFVSWDIVANLRYILYISTLLFNWVLAARDKWQRNGASLMQIDIWKHYWCILHAVLGCLWLYVAFVSNLIDELNSSELNSTQTRRLAPA